MDRNIVEMKAKTFIQEQIVKRKAMFIPIGAVATFMLVGYAAVDKEKPDIVSDQVDVSYGEKLDADMLDITDNRDDNLTVKMDTSSLDVNQLGDYEVPVTATDEYGNATTKTVAVNVVDNEGPKFNTVGKSEGYVVEVPVKGSTDIASYITAEDNSDGNVTDFITASKTLDTSKKSNQDITLTATDTSGNKTTKTYTFAVADTEAPKINLTSGENVTTNYGEAFDINKYANVTDNFDQGLALNVEGNVDTNAIDSTSTLKLTAKDSSGNTSEVNLNVTVKDISAPSIILSQGEVNCNVGDSLDLSKYLSSSTDNKDGDTKSKVSIPTVSTSKAGTKTATYSVTDAAGNTGTANLTVNVKSVATVTKRPTGSSSNVGNNNYGNSVLSAAYSRLGCKYVYGATGPNTFDCSGFTQWCYARAGKSIGRTSGAQGSGGTRIPLSQAQPGDILWKSGHVGIYIGGGKYIHAPHTGDVVRIASDYTRFSYAVRY
ncbi:MAG: NlpC/P60 family protein [Thomasclavelia sp.]|nr:NlpC/P60 family protein [Thomasclavelia sp.]